MTRKIVATTMAATPGAIPLARIQAGEPDQIMNTPSPDLDWEPTGECVPFLYQDRKFDFTLTKP